MLALLAAAPVARGVPFNGVISGNITQAFDTTRPSGAVLPGFGFNTPVFAGEEVTGFYSYDSPTRDTDLLRARDIRISLIFGDPANTMSYLGQSWLLWMFNVEGGQLRFSSIDDSHSPDFSLHLSVDETGFRLVEMDRSGDIRSVTGTLNCVAVPEPGGALLLTGLAVGLLVWVARSARPTSAR
ncbi:MAG TPA: hypothetical protein VG734_21020 [Lacunisphaera sp.]|nr:hypothetical protein [Lacunisphaera sp.]